MSDVEWTGTVGSSCSAPPNQQVAEKWKRFQRQDIILQKLDDFFSHGSTDDIQQLGDNYFLIEEIICLDDFKALDVTVREVLDSVNADSELRFSIRGSKIRLKPPELNDARILLSKRLTWILRHGAEKAGLKYQYGGYLYLDDILKHPQFAKDKVTEEQIISLVREDAKGRFEIDNSDLSGRLRIRALQGHSCKIEGLDLQPIDVGECPVVIHGTYYQNWSSISQTGLSRMSRTHIHFAAGVPEGNVAKSGLRSSADVWIYLDIDAAIKGGIDFVRSRNNVILSEGDENGCIPTKYFKKVLDVRTGKELTWDK
ncbi:hypothetical protein AAHC03_0579 [Spirometra sp. Aus1]